MGTVSDTNGAVVPNATVVIKNIGSGQTFTATTSDGGTYRVPALGSGIYTVTVTANSFKKSVVENVKVDVGTPSTTDVVLEAGDVTATVVVTSGAEVLQTQTATVGSTITGRQITEIPLTSRDALDIVTLLPGTAQVGRPRAATINGLPKGALSITIDGADAANPLLKSSDGFFTYVRPRLDAIEEVTVSTAAGGADSGGDGAVQIKFVTTRGTNQYKGGLYWHHRNTALNAGYFFDNRDRVADPVTGKASRTRALLNQFGGKFGGPLPFPQFGEGGKMFNSGKDRAFFFTNYEEFRLPEAASRTRVILTPTAQAGTFRYITGGATQSVNLLNLLSNNGLVSTVDPTIGALLGQIRTASSSGGSITPISNDLNRENFNFSSNANQVRKFFTLRLDFNLNRNHSLENVTNYQVFRSSIDILNNADNAFPGFPNFGGQDSDRYTNTTALRSNFSSNIINEARFSYLGGPSDFRGTLSADTFANQGGFNLGLNTAFGLTNATAGGANAVTGFSAAGNSDNRRTEETFSFTDNVTWLAGNHTITFGGEYKFFRLSTSSRNQITPNIALGIDATDPINGLLTTANFPGASATQLAQAGGLISLLLGRVTAVNGTAFLKDDQTYGYLADQTQTSEQSVYGLYVQDSWKIRPNLGVNFGIRWQPQGPFITTSKNFSNVSDFNDVFGVSGADNLFKPGTLTGKVPSFIGTDAGYKAFKTDYNNFAPSVGMVWSPNLGSFLGKDGKSVIRTGYSMSFVREGSNVVLSILGSNPGGLIDATKSIALGNLPAGTLLRNRAALSAPGFANTPTYPLAGTTNDSTNAFDPNLKTGVVHSWNLSYQRELTKDTVLEVRYVGNRGVDLWRQYNINELNSIENGFANEFKLAQANLLANNAAGGTRAGSFAFFGAGTGTSPLPIIQSYFRGIGDPTLTTQYTSTLYRNATLLSRLSTNAPSVLGMIGDIDGNAGRRANALAAGLPVNFFRVNPTTRG
ncbi:MAG: TonB-dependent receptor, partial [Blastocatellia bacterium]|nr:TonB-dependent receptor [Blastocatellia bacterium]